MKTLNDDEIKFFCKKYKIDIDSCLQDICKIQNIIASKYYCRNEIKILKSAEKLLIDKGLIKCAK